MKATGTDRRTLIRVAGADDSATADPAAIRQVVDDYVPVGATTLELSLSEALQVGDQVVVARPRPAEWVKQLGADAFGIGWRPGSRDVRWEREIVAIEGNRVTRVDAADFRISDGQYGKGECELAAKSRKNRKKTQRDDL